MSNGFHRPISSNVQWSIKTIIILGAILLFLVVMVVLILKVVIVPKTPVTAEQVWDILVEQGYKPQDITEKYFEEDAAFKVILTKSIAIEKDDIRFEFFVFNNKNSAINTWNQLYGKIYINGFNLIETDTHMANYRIYMLDDKERNSVAIYVENTVVYAYSKSENKNEINKILAAIDYLE